MICGLVMVISDLAPFTGIVCDRRQQQYGVGILAAMIAFAAGISLCCYVHKCTPVVSSTKHR